MMLMVFFSSRISPRASAVIFRKGPVRDRRRHVCDVSDLRREVAGHEVHRIGEILSTCRRRLSRPPGRRGAFGADLARHAGYFRGKGAELIHHRVDGVLQLENFAAASR
jgi:hypothetical protein